MEKFLRDLEAELRKNKLSESEIKDILNDHREMIETAKNEGLSDDDLEKKFGNPKEVAEELSQFTEKEREGKEKTGMETKVFTGIKEGYDVKIELLSEDFTVVFENQDTITVECNGKGNFDEYHIGYENDTFYLRSPKRYGFFNFKGREDKNSFVVTLPKGIKIGEMKAKEINGDCVISDVVAKGFVLETNNGDNKLNNFDVEDFKIHTINGDVEMTGLKAKELKVSQVSGDLSLKSAVIDGDFNLNTVSGDLEIEDVQCKEFFAKTVSGDIDANEFYPESLSLTSVSGDINVTNTDIGRPIEIKHRKSVSGDIEIRVKK